MKKIGLYSFVALMPICAQAMETRSEFPVYFKLLSARYPALHNKTTKIYVEEDTGLTDVIEQLNNKMDIPAEAKLLLEFQGQPLTPGQIPNIRIIRQDGDARLVDGNNPLQDVNNAQKPIKVYVKPR
jgi:hypothetical protein